MISVEIEKSDIDKLVLKIKNFGKDIKLVKKPLEDSAKYMKQQAIANFAAKGSLMQTGGWKDLADSTKKAKKKEVGFIYPMMVRTRTLKNSFHISSPSIGKDFGEIKVYNPIKYAIAHQYSENEVRLPRRILLRFQKQQVENIVNITTRWLDKIIKKDFK